MAAENRHKAFDLAKPACFPPVLCYQRSSFVCCTANLGHRLGLVVLPCDERCPGAWRKHRDARGCQDPARGSECGWISRCSTDGTWSSLPAMTGTSSPLMHKRLRSGTCARTYLACSSPLHSIWPPEGPASAPWEGPAAVVQAFSVRSRRNRGG